MNLASTLRVNPLQNSAIFPCGKVLQFSRRWSATMLALLLLESHNNRPLSATALNAELQRLGKTKPLTRAQQSLLVQELRTACAEVGECGFSLEADRATVGPWRLRLHEELNFTIDDQDGRFCAAADRSARQSGWSWPKLMADGAPGHLRLVLSHCLTARAFALEGNFQDAIDSLQLACELPLTNDGRILLLLRIAKHHKRVGEFAEARERIGQIMRIKADTTLGHSLHAQAGMVLDRISYDESPGTAHERLWDMMQAPEPGYGQDPQSMMAWHNLRAALARRRLHAIVIGKLSAQEGETAHSLHELAMNHLESAAYCALALNDYSFLQAVVANRAYHLQGVLLLEMSSVVEVFNWYALMVNFAEKLDLGKESAWDYIYLGQFWLDYHSSFEASGQYRDAYGAYNSLAFIGRAHPSEEQFYLTALERAEQCADIRQQAIARINHMRFAQWHLSEFKHARSEQALRVLLQRTPNLRDLLAGEGYGAYLPA